ncbi:MAG: hypothetical protein ACRDQZ_07655 [Mycobacteriales bacterium]
MMRADYDSEANALAIDLQQFDRYDRQDQVDDDYCTVGFAGSVPVRVSLLAPARHLGLLDVAAERYGLDAPALLAAAQAALAAPDRVVELEVAARVAA